MMRYLDLNMWYNKHRNVPAPRKVATAACFSDKLKIGTQVILASPPDSIACLSPQLPDKPAKLLCFQKILRIALQDVGNHVRQLDHIRFIRRIMLQVGALLSKCPCLSLDLRVERLPAIRGDIFIQPDTPQGTNFQDLIQYDTPCCWRKGRRVVKHLWTHLFRNLLFVQKNGNHPAICQYILNRLLQDLGTGLVTVKLIGYRTAKLLSPVCHIGIGRINVLDMHDAWDVDINAYSLFLRMGRSRPIQSSVHDTLEKENRSSAGSITVGRQTTRPNFNTDCARPTASIAWFCPNTQPMANFFGRISTR